MSLRKPPYSSVFATDIENYIDFKAAMGFEGLTRNYVLYDFDRWCRAHDAKMFDKDTVTSWVQDRDMRAPNAGDGWKSTIRDFGRYLKLCGFEDAYVLSYAYQSKKMRPLPYLLSADEAEVFFDAAARYQSPGPMGWQSPCLFGLMYAIGLRPMEARNLRRCDIRFPDLEVDIVQSKANRSRRLAVSAEVMEMIEKCDHATTKAMGADRPFLFMSIRRGQVPPSSVSTAFRRIWNAAGLPKSQHGRKPTCYLFRHHFAYANIERWRSEGLDPNVMLPYLSRYMGHSSIDKTLYYVHTSPDFTAGFSGAIAGLDGLLPEVGFDG